MIFILWLMAPMMVTLFSFFWALWITSGSTESLGYQILFRIAHMSVVVSSM